MQEGAAAAPRSAKVKIAIEVVWNNFITKPEQLIEYVDEFKSRCVGGLLRLLEHDQVRRRRRPTGSASSASGC